MPGPLPAGTMARREIEAAYAMSRRIEVRASCARMCALRVIAYNDKVTQLRPTLRAAVSPPWCLLDFCNHFWGGGMLHPRPPHASGGSGPVRSSPPLPLLTLPRNTTPSRTQGEERAIDAALMVFTSTHQEVKDQWGLYDG
jgi:hypothetical protein